MKKIFTAFLLLVSITSTSFATKRIAFVTNSTPTANGDSLIRKELAKTYTLIDIDVSSLDTASVRAKCQADTIDMVLLSEPLSTSSCKGLLGVQGVKKPILNMKVYAYKSSTTTLSWSSSTLWGDDASNLTIAVSSGETSHSIFSGLTSPISVITKIGTSSSTSKGIDYANITQSLLTSGTLTQLATVGSNTCILEIAAGSTMLNVKTSTSFSFPNKFIQFGINSVSEPYITSDGLTLVKNICDYLTSGSTTGISTTTENSSFKAIGLSKALSVEVPSTGTVKIISINGALVAQKVISTEASFSLPQGTYVVQYITGATTTAKTVIVK